MNKKTKVLYVSKSVSAASIQKLIAVGFIVVIC